MSTPTYILLLWCWEFDAKATLKCNDFRDESACRSGLCLLYDAAVATEDNVFAREFRDQCVDAGDTERDPPFAPCRSWPSVCFNDFE